jgi:hypothetical protein
MNFRPGVVLGVLLSLVFASFASGQIASGDITGRIADSAGKPSASLSVTVTNEATGFSRTVTTADDGGFTIPALMPGLYRVDVTAAGGVKTQREHVLVTTGQKTRVNFALAPSITEHVNVVVETPLLRTGASSLGAIIEQTQVEHLPLNGRTFITLAALAPGVALPPGSLLPRINGGRPRTNEYLYDGISVLQPEPGQVAFFPVIDAIDEFRIESNSAPAEFGRFNGGVVNLTTRGGTNAYQGGMFEFARNESLNARNYFQRSNPTKPEYSRHQFGGTFGGPIIRNRTFFFVDYQGQQQSIGRTVTSTVPTVLQRQGIFTEAIAGKVPSIFDPGSGSPRTPFAGNQIPLERQVALSLLQRYPMPTSDGTANNFSRTDLENDDQNQWDARLDHRFQTDRDHMFVRISQFHDAFTPVTPLPDGSGVTTGTLGPQDTVSWSFASHYQRTFGTNWLNEIRVGDTRRRVTRSATELPTSAGAALGIPGLPSNASFANVLPTFLISGYQQLGSPANTASSFDTGVTQIADSLTWTHGRHSVKAGLDWRWERLNVIQPPSPTGSFTFNTLGSNQPGASNTGTPLASFLLGQVQQFSIDLQQSIIQERAHIQEYFIQDDWRVSSRFTVNAGLRYTLNFPSNEINGQVAVFNLDSQLLEYPGTEPVRPLKKDNFGPRIGAVYRMNDKTIVSGGYGLVWIEMAGITTPFTTPTFPFLQTVGQRSLDSIAPAFLLKNGPSVAPIPLTPTAGLGQGVFAVNANLGSGYVQQWNVSAQRQITKDTTVEVAYVGSRITNVGIPDSNVNQLTVEQLAMGSVLLTSVANPYFGIIPRSSSLGDPLIPYGQLLKPYPQYTTVSQYRNNVGETNYEGLEISARRRLSNGLLFSVSYTRSKLTDAASSVFDASILTGPVANFQIADSYDLSRETDYSTGDIPHIFVSSVVWDLPWGNGRHWNPAGWVGALVNDWGMTGVVTVQSGVPVAITQVTNFNAFAGFGTQRPNLIGDPQLPADQRNQDHWFNTAAFAIAPQFTLGDASRNPARGPSYRNVDLAVARTVPVRNGTSVELRVEIFNALNNVQLGAPAGVAGAANFGMIITAFDPRVIQLAVKFHF